MRRMMLVASLVTMTADLLLPGCASEPMEWRKTPAAAAIATAGSPDETYQQADAACNYDSDKATTYVRGIIPRAMESASLYKECMKTRGWELVRAAQPLPAATASPSPEPPRASRAPTLPAPSTTVMPSTASSPTAEAPQQDEEFTVTLTPVAPSGAKTAEPATDDPCAPYAADPVARLRCKWVTGPERDRYVPEIGRSASLRTQMACIPDRDDAERYATCIARGGA